MFFNLRVELIKEEDRTEMLLRCEDINDTTAKCLIVNWDLIENRRRR